MHAQAAAQQRLAASELNLKKNLEDLSTAIKGEQEQIRVRTAQTRAAEIDSIHAQISGRNGARAR